MKPRKAPANTLAAMQDRTARDENQTPFESRAFQVPITAHMIFDSSLSSLPSGMRGMERDRHLLFVAPGLDIHLKIAEVDRHKEIYGQVIPHGPAEELTAIMLVREQDPEDMRTPDEFGEFSFNNVPAGDLVIEIALASRRVVAAFDV